MTLNEYKAITFAWWHPIQIYHVTHFAKDSNHPCDGLNWHRIRLNRCLKWHFHFSFLIWERASVGAELASMTNPIYLIILNLTNCGRRTKQCHPMFIKVAGLSRSRMTNQRLDFESHSASGESTSLSFSVVQYNTYYIHMKAISNKVQQTIKHHLVACTCFSSSVEFGQREF